MLREVFSVDKRESLAFYSLASLANLFLSVPQFQAVNTALQLGIRPQVPTGILVIQYGSMTSLALVLAIEILIFQGVMAALTIGVSVIASTPTRRNWQYSISAVLVASYLAYHLGGKFLNTLQWIGVLEISGVNVSSAYGDLFWFGLLATICFLLAVLLLRRSYGTLVTASLRRIT